MAGGTIRSSTGSGLEIKVVWSAKAHNATNSSTVAADVYIEHYEIYSAALAGSYVKIGDSVHSFNAAVNSSAAGKSETKVASYSAEISHNDDGSKNVEISAGWRFAGVYNGVSIGTLSCSETVALDRTARASAASFDRSTVTAGEKLGLKITRHDASFRHRVQLTVGTKESYTAFLDGSSPSFTVPASLAEGVTNSANAEVHAILHTYTADNKWLGSSDMGKTAFRVPAAEAFLPSFNLATASYSPYPAIAENGIYAAGRSGVKVSVSSAAGKYGAAVSGCSVSVGVRSISDAQSKSTYTLYFPLDSAGEFDAVVSVTDSRGLVRRRSVKLTVQPYGAPSFKNVEIFRCDGDGKKHDGGAFVSVRASAVYSQISGGGFTNSAGITAEIYARGGEMLLSSGLVSGECSVLAGGLSPRKSYDVKLKITDAAGLSGLYSETLPTSRVDFHLKDGGARLGGWCEREGFECDWDARFGGDLSIGGSSVCDFVVSEGREGIWTYRKWKSGVAECFGTTEIKSYTLEDRFGTGLYITRADEKGRNSQAFPKGLFIDVPSVFAAPCHKEYTYLISPRDNATKEKSADYYIIGESSTNVYNVSLSLHAVGRWKV